MPRLRGIRAGFAADVKKAERDLFRAQTRLEAARTKLKVADEMIATLEKNDPLPGSAFPGIGKYSHMALSDAILDVINNHAGIDGMSVNEIQEILVNEGVAPKPHLSATIHVTAGRLDRKGLITAASGEDGKRFFSKTQPEEAAAPAEEPEFP